MRGSGPAWAWLPSARRATRTPSPPPRPRSPAATTPPTTERRISYRIGSEFDARRGRGGRGSADQLGLHPGELLVGDVALRLQVAQLVELVDLRAAGRGLG